MRLGTLTLCATFLLIAAPGAMQEAQPPAITEADLQGQWRLRGSVGAAEQRRNSAIERATEDMSIFTRGIARRRLRNGTPIHRTLSFGGEGATFRAHVGPYHLEFAPNGRGHAYTDPIGGDDMRASMRIRNRRLTQVYRNDDATLTHTVMLSNDGQRITLTIRIASHHLPGDVVYRTTYARS
ncbi:MAG: hypothetical protein AAF411_02145 [Myxococcota bacterium]